MKRRKTVTKEEADLRIVGDRNMISDYYLNVDPSTVVVACMPDHTTDQLGQGTIWMRRFIGVKTGDNPNGTIRVLVSGTAPDLKQSVFRKL